MALPTLRHFTHPTHILRKEAPDTKVAGYQNGRFICDACNTLGSGIRYHCKQCQFDLHEECATCPEDLTCSYLQHNKHQFSLVWEGSELIKGVLRSCDVCGDQVNGLFYKGTSGGSCLFLHPSCSNFPSQLHHVMDKRHPLTFQSFPVIRNSACTVCGGVVDASSWSYRCDPCGINIHLECLLLPYLGMHHEKKPIPPPASSPYDGNAGTASLAYRYNYPPSSHYYSYTPTPAYQYSSTEMPLPPYHNYYTPSSSSQQETTSSSGGSKRRMYVLAGRIALRLIFTATFGVPILT
ncbi:hypothetical protein MKW92_020275 [Papaver armeniacum]|nr:hypothetical protein MKW92_020275 [Papaver armeniacum]